MGNVVVDHERVTRTFPEGRGVLDAVAIYEVENGKIAKVWLILGPKTLDAKP
jgi:putative hydrolase of HD superfamily